MEGGGRVYGPLAIAWRIVLSQKMRGHLGKNISQKSRNSYRLNGGGVGTHGQLTPGPDVLSPRFKYKSSKNCFSHIYSAQLRAHLGKIVGASRACFLCCSFASASFTSGNPSPLLIV